MMIIGELKTQVEKLLGASIPVPSLELQQRVTNRVAAVERLKGKHRAERDDSAMRFAALQDKAFKGELS